MLARLLVVLVAALVAAPAAAAAPSNLHGFLLRSSESPSPHVFSRTPSFAWKPVRGATRYEFQLSTSRRFAENAIVWEKANLKPPLTTVPLTLPWMTGHSRYSWFARVRAFVGSRPTGWSTRYGFDLRSPSAPVGLSSGVNPRPGLVRWTPIDGATAYEVTFTYSKSEGTAKKIKTATTAADLREYYTFHNDPTFFDNQQGPRGGPAPGPEGAVYWRVRAVREVTGKPKNNIPVVSYGPWSSENETIEPGIAPGAVSLLGAISRSRSSAIISGAFGGVTPHELIPGFWWSGEDGRTACPASTAALGITCPLFHVYVYSDADCVNRVHASDLVGSPAYVPRLTPPLKLPESPAQLTLAANLYLGDAGDGEPEGKVYTFAGEERVYAAGTDPLLPSDETTVPEGQVKDRRSGIWDSDWPSGRYWWTVVPAVPHVNADNQVEYRDVEFAEEMCQAGERMAFGKTSAVVVERASGVPYVSGLTSAGRVRPASSSRPAFFGRVVVAWKPAPGAKKYEVQWSRTKNPWNRAGRVVTPATAAQLNLPDGVWYYRVRGIDTSIPSLAQGMTWSSPQYLRIRPRTFVVG
jgi:hypothetical protein